MATYKKMAPKPFKREPLKGQSILNELNEFIPKTPKEVPLFIAENLLIGKALKVAKIGLRAGGGITKTGAKYVAKTYRNMGK